MVGSNATLKGLFLITLLGVGCGGGSSFTGYTGGTGGMLGSAGNSSGTAGTGSGSAGTGYGTAGAGTAGTGYGSAGTGYGTAGAGTAGAGTAGYAGNIGVAGYSGSLGTAGAGTAGAGTAGAGTAGAGTAGAGTAGSTGDPCTSLMAKASAALASATECNPAADALQCTGVVSDLCGCDVSVNQKDSQATQAYLSYQKQISMMGCVQSCTDVLCQAFTTGVCQTNMTSSTGGICYGLGGAAF